MLEEIRTSKIDVQSFWNANACGKKFIVEEFGTPTFFNQLERHRYKLEPHILEIIPFKDFKGKKVLEIGCGLGTDAIQFGRVGADYHAIDLTPTAVEMTQKRFSNESLSAQIQVGDSESIPYPDNYFDLVYSHGVIHHTVDIEKAVSEIYRVIKPGGKTIVMVYHKNSINYYLNILFLRRLGFWALFLPGGETFVNKLTGESIEALRLHKKQFRERGFSYLSAKNFLNVNTDGPGNPLSRVHSSKELLSLFNRFHSHKVIIRYLNTHRIPVIRHFMTKSLVGWLASKFGWHIYIFAQK